jgi:hypothetical protein
MKEWRDSMGAGGLGNGIGYLPSLSVSKEINAEEQLSKIEYQVFVNKTIKDYLSDSQRDVALTSERLDALKEVLSSDMDTFKTLFGGSVRKHTYVEGLSDIDVLLILNDTDLEKKDTTYVKNYLYDNLKTKKIRDVKDIRVGVLAITIRYKDDSEIQLLPAIRKDEKFRIPGKDGKWSSLIHPEKFAKSLVNVNKENNGKVIQTIKIIKGIQSKLPEEDRLSGYHIESLAMKIFERNEKSMSHQERVLYFLERSIDHVKKPIKDRTNQSAFVDEYLGSEDSPQRIKVSRALEKIYSKLKVADTIKNVDAWKSILEVRD